MLPISSAEGVVTPFSDALFTSTSAVCVTGLVVHDTYRYWSLFGKTCILVLIQIGGLGTITLAMIVTMLSGRKISLFQRSVMKDAISADQIGGMGHFSLFILQSTLAAELLGVLLLWQRSFWEFFFSSPVSSGGFRCFRVFNILSSILYLLSATQALTLWESSSLIPP